MPRVASQRGARLRGRDARAASPRDMGSCLLGGWRCPRAAGTAGDALVSWAKMEQLRADHRFQRALSVPALCSAFHNTT